MKKRAVLLACLGWLAFSPAHAEEDLPIYGIDGTIHVFKLDDNGYLLLTASPTAPVTSFPMWGTDGLIHNLKIDANGYLVVAGDVGGDTTGLAELITLSGVAAESEDLGTFTGTTISDSDTIKAAFQELETFVEGLGGGHAPVTLDANADTLFSLSTQELGLDTQTANLIFSGPSSAGPSVPTFRSLVAADIPDLSSVYQPLDADLTTYAGITPSANVQSLLGSADYAAMRGLLDLEAGTDFYSVSGADAAFLPLSVVKSAIWPSGASIADGTQCADSAKTTINSGPVVMAIICADNDASSIYGDVTMPDSWNGGTVTFEMSYIQTAADTSALNGDITAQCHASGETVNSTWGSEVAMDDAAVSGSNIIDHLTSGAVTPAGTCAAGDTLFWRWQMDATGTTTAVATLKILGWKMEYTASGSD